MILHSAIHDIQISVAPNNSFKQINKSSYIPWIIHQYIIKEPLLFFFFFFLAKENLENLKGKFDMYQSRRSCHDECNEAPTPPPSKTAYTFSPPPNLPT